MKKIVFFIYLSLIIFLFSTCSNKRPGKPRLLIFSKSTGFRHNSIPNGIAAIQKLGAENNFETDTTENADWFIEDTLKKYAAIVFLNTTGDVLNYRQEAAFERYIQAGGGFVGVHSATDAEYDWGWYGRLVGGYFNGHPTIQEAKFIIKDKDHPSTKFFTDTIWQRRDELYNFKKLNPDVHVLITIDEKSYTGGTNGTYHPMAWYHDYDGGRAFYTELGHTEESYTEPQYLQHLLGGIQYAIGENKELNYAKAHTQFPPDEDRFTKTNLIQGEFFEPTEMTVLPNLDILVIQRRGEILLYKNETKKIKQAGFFNVYWKSHVPGVNAEEGMLGISKDPDFAKNHWVYIYYSPVDTSVNRLSRFEFKNDTIDARSEKIILQLYSQREICCHTGGSIAFGPDGLLYVSTGDNSTPFDEPKQAYVNHGYAPLNDEPGHEQYDARRSAGNPNDLRGKILRIKLKEDGTYEIPEGNLYPKGEAGTRPEIYVQGNRNPYRISVDQKTGFVYWGEVGPDAANDSFDTRGPRGYDEVNQARKAGNFGWPLFVGNNYAYHSYDYATGTPGAAFDPNKPINASRNNTGIKELPPAQPAFIWYPYANSSEFPQVGTGGRNAMAGPVYYTDMFPKESRYPDYFDKKLFIYDWIRGWVKVVTMQKNGDFDKMEPFMEHTKFVNPIDMEVGPDGKLYVLEYGSGWFSKNEDAGLSRIGYTAGNRPPEITSIHADKLTGVLPFTVKLTIAATDPDNDKIRYIWNLGNGIKKETTAPELEYTFDKMGDYAISAEVKDDKGSSATSKAINIYAGNETPVISIDIKGNKTFYFPGKPIAYSIIVNDKNDTTKIDPANLYVSADYLQGYDKASVTEGHQQVSATVIGKSLTFSLDCKSCHKENEKSIGPSFMQVAQKYKKDPAAPAYLSQKIIKGGGGVWGEVQMASHPTLPQTDVQQIVSWILSLGDSTSLKKSLPRTGSFKPSGDQKPGSTLVLSASYTDKGGNNSKSLTGSNTISLQSNLYLFSRKEPVKGFTTANLDGVNYMNAPSNEGWFELKDIDLSGIASADMNVAWQIPPEYGFDFEFKLDSANGKLVGKGSLLHSAKNVATGKLQPGIAHIAMESLTDGKLHNLFVICRPRDAKETSRVRVASIKFNAD